jgi:hypothetical protein
LLAADAGKTAPTTSARKAQFLSCHAFLPPLNPQQVDGDRPAHHQTAETIFCSCRQVKLMNSKVTRGVFSARFRVFAGSVATHYEGNRHRMFLVIAAGSRSPRDPNSYRVDSTLLPRPGQSVR